jgi:hypothetical protein
VIEEIVEEVIKVLSSNIEGFETYTHFRTTVIEEPKQILPNLNYSSGTLRPLDQDQLLPASSQRGPPFMDLISIIVALLTMKITP